MGWEKKNRFDKTFLKFDLQAGIKFPVRILFKKEKGISYSFVELHVCSFLNLQSVYF